MAVIRYNELLGVGASTALSVSTADASVALVAGQRYRVLSTADCYLRVGAAAVTTGASAPILARVPEEMCFAKVGEAAPVVHAITASGTGTIYFSPLSEV